MSNREAVDYREYQNKYAILWGNEYNGSGRDTFRMVRLMPVHPLAEVFGFPVDNFSDRAQRYRKNRLCPYNNRVPNCTKDKANDPLGVCSIFSSEGVPVITCPVRFREDWIIAEDAAAFLFPPGAQWTSLGEVRLNDADGESAGNIDIVLVTYDDRGAVMDFGSLEVQAVYVSGNIREPFGHYMQDPASRFDMDWRHRRGYPRADYLSSSRKRLVPQLIYKGGILRHWGKKQVVALHTEFFRTLPPLSVVAKEDADMAWLVYDLVADPDHNQYHLRLSQTVYTLFKPALDQILTSKPGPIDQFMDLLQEKLDRKLENDENPPDAPTLADLL